MLNCAPRSALKPDKTSQALGLILSGNCFLFKSYLPQKKRDRASPQIRII